MGPSHEDAFLFPLLDVPCHQKVVVQRRGLVAVHPQVGLQILEETSVVVPGLPSRYLENKRNIMQHAGNKMAVCGKIIKQFQYYKVTCFV
jgi:hypothetical protein